MTIEEMLTKNNIEFQVIHKMDKSKLLKISNTGVLVWINENNIFKFKRKIFDEFLKVSDKQAYLLMDKSAKKYYYLKFQTQKNWLTEGFYNCDKSEIFLGKQIMNYSKKLSEIMIDLKKL